MRLAALTLEQCEQVRLWRNDCMVALRTPYMLTREQQEQFYRDVVCNRNARSRWWAVTLNGDFVGQVGLENIEWENGVAEISIMLSPDCRGKGLGEQALHLLLNEGFNQMRLDDIYGECYACNPAMGFWLKMAAKYHAKTANLPHRKTWNGAKFDSLYFNITKEAFNRCQK